MKLSDWAKKEGVAYLTAYRWFKDGNLPCNARQTKTGTILVEDAPAVTTRRDRTVIYCRVSNHSRKDEIQYQVDRCEEFCRARGHVVDRVYKEIASGMNDERKIFWEMIEADPTRIVVENKDRLTRFGFNYLERLLAKRGCVIEVMNRDKIDETDLIKDMIAIVTSFCCRLYGARRGQNKAKKIKAAIGETDDTLD